MTGSLALIGKKIAFKKYETQFVDNLDGFRGQTLDLVIWLREPDEMELMTVIPALNEDCIIIGDY